MTLLTGSPETVQVFVDVDADNGYGATIRVPSTNPVVVTGCSVSPMNSRSSGSAGQQATTLYRLAGRGFPEGSWSYVVWRGREWDVVGEPQIHNGSAATAHVSARLRSRAPEPVA